MIRKVLQWPDPLLTTRRSLPVFPGEAVDKLVADMFETMKAEGGCGLAAIQVGVPIRLFVLEIGGAREVCLNPEWTPWRGTYPVMMDEGCLSVPEPRPSEKEKGWSPTLSEYLDRALPANRYFRAMVPRYERINVEYMTQQGSVVKASCRDLKAQVFQHEHDHLEGVLKLAKILETRSPSLADEQS